MAIQEMRMEGVPNASEARLDLQTLLTSQKIMLVHIGNTIHGNIASKTGGHVALRRKNLLPESSEFIISIYPER
jgi:hypothetical protein